METIGAVEALKRPKTVENLTKVYGERIHVSGYYHVEKVIYMKNGCCPDLPVLLTSNFYDGDKINYSCQCACGCWCSQGFDTEAKAICDYERMSDEDLLFSADW